MEVMPAYAVQTPYLTPFDAFNEVVPFSACRLEEFVFTRR